MDKVIYAQTRIVTEEMTDAELLAIFLAADADSDPRDCQGYEKAESLFVQTFSDGIPRMHGAVKEAFTAIVSERLI